MQKSAPEGPLITRQDIHQALRRVGLEPGKVVLTHSSLSGAGWVAGGAVTVLRALLEVLGASGTLVMPGFSTDLSDPALWENPPVPQDWWQTVRDSLPAYHPDWTPTVGVGCIPECFRRVPGTLRSEHPQFSFLAQGPRAQSLLEFHPLTSALGEESPLARMYDAHAKVLLFCVGHESNTSLHLSEHRAELTGDCWEENGAPLFVEGHERWVPFRRFSYDACDFSALGRDFESLEGSVRLASLGKAQLRLMEMRRLVDFGVHWLSHHR